MSKVIDLKGQRFGRLTVVELAEPHIDPKGRRLTRWKCVCDCGNTVEVLRNSLIQGHSKSCGCLHSEISREVFTKMHTTHGGRHTRLYGIWCGMKNRCYNENVVSFPDYGGRGITVCSEWLDNFAAFRDWALANGYRDDLSIDRRNNDMGYSPDNCRWATGTDQANNKRTSRSVTLNGESRTIAEWSKLTGINASVLSWRARNGWTPEEIINGRN